MPIIQVDENEALPDVREYEMQSSTDPTFGEVNRAMFDTGFMNELGGAVARFGKEYDPEDDYDVFDDLNGYEVYADKFIGVESRQEAADIKRRIDDDLQARETIAAGSGLEVLGASVVQGAVDPITWIPVGGTAYRTYRTGGRILEGAAKTAATGMGVSIVEEVALQNMQEVRTAEESFTNVAATTMLSGLLGGAVGAMSGHELQALAKRLDDDLTVPQPGGSTVGAKEVNDTTLDQEGLVSAGGLEKWLSFQDPVLRTLNSPSRATRQLSEQLAESYLYKGKNEDFIASEISVENMVKSYNLPKYDFFKTYDQLFLEYRKSQIKNQYAAKNAVTAADVFGKARRDNKMTYQEFGDAVVRAARRNDQHAIPEVAQAAQALREKYFTPIFKRGVEQKIFDEEMQVTTAPSYVTRLYDRSKILADLPRWKERNITWMKKRRDEAAESISDLEEKIGGQRDMIRMRRREVAAVEDTTFQSVIRVAEENMQKSVDDALAQISIDGLPSELARPKTKADMEAQARRKQDSAYIKQLKAEIAEDLADEVDEVLQVELRAIVKEAIDETDEIDGDEIFNFLRDDLLQPMRGAVTETVSDEVASRMGASQMAAIRKSIDTFNKSLERQAARIADQVADADLEKKLLSKVRADVKKAARSGAQKAARESTAGLREELRKLLFELKDNKKLLERNRYKAGQLDEEIVNTVDELTNRILSTPAGRLPYDVKLRRDGPAAAPGKAGLRGAARQRVYDIPDEMIEDFLVNDIEAIVESYGRSLSSDIELTRAFGSADYTDVLKRIEEDYSRLSNGADAKTARKLKQAFDRDVRDIKGMWERLRGTYAVPDDYAGLLPTAERVALNWNYMRLLGGMTISAFTDIARPVMTQGLGSVYRDGVRGMVKNFGAFREAAEEVKEAGTALDMVLNTRARALAGMDDYVPFTNRMEGVVGAMANGFGVISLMAPWNAGMKQFSGVITQANIMRAVSDLAAGKTLPQGKVTNLAANFIDKDMALRIAEQFKQHGREVDGVVIPCAQAWDDVQAQTVFRAAVRREVDSIIVTPGQDKPLWMSRPGVKLVGQFKSFAIASVQRTMLSGLQRRDMATLNGAALSLFLGMGVYATKESVAGRPLSDDWRIWVSEGVDRSGLAGWAFDANNIVEKISRGRIGMNAVVGGPPMSRYASRSALEAMFGPTYGAIGDAVGVAGSAFAGEWRSSDTAAVRKLMPYQNLFYLRRIFDEAENAINEAIGQPATKGQQ